MIAPELPAAAGAVMLALGAIAMSRLAVRRARSIARQSEDRAREQYEALQVATALLEKALDAQGKRIAELEQLPALTPNLPRPGMNLSKRSQVLRLHRKGDSPDRIAAALELPRQEVDLLIKVHRIVLGNL